MRNEEYIARLKDIKEKCKQQTSCTDCEYSYIIPGPPSCIYGGPGCKFYDMFGDIVPESWIFKGG